MSGAPVSFGGGICRGTINIHNNQLGMQPLSLTRLSSEAQLRAEARRIVGVIPAAGFARRLGAISCSKEMLPVGFQNGSCVAGRGRKPVSQYLVEQMKFAGCAQVYFVVRAGKWDIAEYYQSGRDFGLDIAYLMMGDPWGPPFTLSQATSFVRGATVVVGFPDILVHPQDALARTVARLRQTEADVVLGTFPAARNDLCDIVQSESGGRVVRLVPKEEASKDVDRQLTWMFAAWGPRFTSFLHQEISRLGKLAQIQRDSSVTAAEPEWPLGAVIASGMNAGLSIDSVFFRDGVFLDIGLPGRLAEAARFPGVWGGAEASLS